MLINSQPATTMLPSERRGSKSNVIILTSGLSGSSVLAGLIARDNYWPGNETFKKEYDTYENLDLVKLNMNLLREVGYRGRYEMEFREEVLEHIAALGSRVDHAPYREFLANCDRHQPWVWKDPRLWLTIRFWNRLLDWDRCKAIVLTRSLVHCWVSTTLRRQIRSYRSLMRYEKCVENSILAFLEGNGIECLHTSYEQLITRPEETIDRLNAYIGSNLVVDDLESVYHGELYKTPRNSPVDFLKAVLIYMKNYSERWDLNERKS